MALSASLCCITPVIALVAGTSGVASTFSWLEPLRPFLIGLTVLVLVFAWYQKLKPKKEADCECDPSSKSNFFQSKFFLGILTVFSIIMLAFPYYSGIFYPKTENGSVVSNIVESRKCEFRIEGMTCASCEEHVDHKVRQLEGIVSIETSYDLKQALVVYDPSKITEKKIKKTINSTGYKVVGVIKRE